MDTQADGVADSSLTLWCGIVGIKPGPVQLNFNKGKYYGKKQIDEISRKGFKRRK